MIQRRRTFRTLGRALWAWVKSMKTFGIHGGFEETADGGTRASLWIGRARKDGDPLPQVDARKGAA